MRHNHSQRHQLHRIEARLLRSDPQLAAMLTIFSRLSAGQLMPAWEQLATRQDHIRQAAAVIAKTIAVIVAAIRLLLGAVLDLLTAIMLGSRRPRQRTRPQARPGTGADADSPREAGADG